MAMTRSDTQRFAENDLAVTNADLRREIADLRRDIIQDLRAWEMRLSDRIERMGDPVHREFVLLTWVLSMWIAIMIITLGIMIGMLIGRDPI
jgi:hypothetical protein